MPTGALKDVQLGYVETYEDVQDFMTWLGQSRPVLSFDTETAGLDPWAADARIRLAQFGDLRTGWTIPWHRWPGLVAEVFSKIRKNRQRLTIHNVAFDGRYAAVKAAYPEFELPWELVDDTMIMSRLAEPLKSAALKRISDAHVDPTASVGQQMLRTAMDTNKWTWDTVPIDFDTYRLYGAMDTVLGAHVWIHYQPWLAEGSNRSVYELEMATRRICTAMELRGFRIDDPYCQKQLVVLREYVEECIGWAQHSYDGLSIGSPRQLAKWVIDNGGVIDQFTPTGLPQLNKDMLKKLIIEPTTPAHVKQLCELALKARKAEKQAGTYFDNFLRYSRSDDGLLHPNINTLAARTHRMSVTDPALQTLSKQEATVRDAFIAHNEDEVLVTCDADQIEARLFANFSRDSNLIHAFDGPEDFFVNIARAVYADPTLMKSDKRRSIIKNYTYGKLYGAGLAKLSLTAGVPLAQVTAVQTAMDAEYPGIKRFQQEVTRRAEITQEIVTPLGRKLQIEDPSKAYVATNYTIQGHAAEILKLALVNMDNCGLSEYMILPVHDEVVCSVPRDLAEDVAHVMEECMTFTDKDLYPVPLTASAEGPFERWGDKIRAAA